MSEQPPIPLTLTMVHCGAVYLGRGIPEFNACDYTPYHNCIECWACDLYRSRWLKMLMNINDPDIYYVLDMRQPGAKNVLSAYRAYSRVPKDASADEVKFFLSEVNV